MVCPIIAPARSRCRVMVGRIGRQVNWSAQRLPAEKSATSNLRSELSAPLNGGWLPVQIVLPRAAQRPPQTFVHALDSTVDNSAQKWLRPTRIHLRSLIIALIAYPTAKVTHVPIATHHVKATCVHLHKYSSIMSPQIMPT